MTKLAVDRNYFTDKIWESMTVPNKSTIFTAFGAGIRVTVSKLGRRKTLLWNSLWIDWRKRSHQCNFFSCHCIDLNNIYNNTHLTIHHVSAVWYHRALVCKFCVGLRQQVRYVRNYFDFFILEKKYLLRCSHKTNKRKLKRNRLVQKN